MGHSDWFKLVAKIRRNINNFEDYTKTNEKEAQSLGNRDCHTGNPYATILRRQNKKRVSNIVKPEIHTIKEVVPMADQTMKELLQAPTEGDAPNDAIKLMLFSYSPEVAARIWESSSKTDNRIDMLADQISNLVEIVNKQVISPATVKAVEKTCMVCGGALAYYDCIATDSNQSSVCWATDKLAELAKVPLNENCLAMLLKKLPEKLGDPRKFLIPCDFPRMEVCHALANLGASINLMPLSIWKKLSLPELTPTQMTLELADRSITRPKGVAEDVFVKVGKFHFPTDFVVVDFEADSRVPLILGRSFLRTDRALIDVYGKEITLQVNDEFVTFNLNQTMRYFSTYDDNSVNQVDVIDMACEEYAQDVLDFKYNSKNGNPTMVFNPSPSKETKSELCKEPIVKSSSPMLIPFGERIDKLPVIIAKDLKEDEKEALIKVLKSHKWTIAWKIIDIKGIDLRFCTHKILMEEDYKPTVQSQRQVNLKIHEVIKKEVIKLLDAGMIYLIFDSPWVSPIHYVPKKGGMTVVANKNNELIPTRLVTDGFSGYFQIPIDPQDQEKTTFTCPYGTFAYRRMPFGLCNAPDHSALNYPLSKQDAKPRLLRWDLLLQEFDITIRDKKGSENLVADHLSRLENPHKDVCENKDIIENFPLETLGSISTGRIDFMGPFSSSHGNRYILVAVDYFSKWVEAKALPTNDARAVVKFLKSLFARFRTPRAIISYRRTYFCNDQFARVMTKYGVTHRLATAYHPQMSGKVEVSNRGLKRILERMVGENHASWSDKLDYALWAIRTAFKTLIGCTYYKIVYGKSCHPPIELEHKAY
nr:DNA-directed DNA polymerase [Tanacetum cinerariifolium]